MTRIDALRRTLAPILPEAWQLIDDEAKRVLALNLAGRKLVDFRGPLGWEFAAVNTGRIETLPDSPAPQVKAALRRVHPVLELHAPFRLSLAELEPVARGATDPDLEPVTRAAEQIARAEDSVVFNGFQAGGMPGIIAATPHERVPVKSAADYPRAILAALELLRQSAVGGPYAVAFGRKAYDEVFAAHPEGYPVAKQIQRQIVDGPLLLAPAIEGALVISMRGGDYELTVGHDLAVGFARQDGNEVELFLTESLAFRVLEPGAAVALVRQG